MLDLETEKLQNIVNKMKILSQAIWGDKKNKKELYSLIKDIGITADIEEKK